MATSAASAAGSDSNRAAYARNTETINGSNRLRVDESTLSAFDLLLDLPIFDSQIPPVKTDSEYKSTSEQEVDDDSDSDDQDSNLQDTLTSQNLVPIPIIQRIEETQKQDSSRFDENDIKIDPDRIRTSDDPNEKHAQDKPVVELKREPDSAQTTEALNPEVVDALPTDLHDERETQSIAPDVAGQPVVDAVSNRVDTTQNEQHDQVSLDVDERSLDRNDKASKTLTKEEAPSSEPLNTTSPPPKSANSDQANKVKKLDVDTESAEPPSNTTPFVNRRADRLAEARRGDSSSDGDQPNSQQSPESLTANGNVNTPDELTLANEPIDPTQAIDPLNASTSIDPTELSAAIPDSGIASQTMVATPILSTGVVATASVTTSVVGLESSKDATVNGVVGSQGGAPLSESSASRSTASLTGRGTTLSPYQEQRVLQRVLKGLDQLDNGGGAVRLRLHPPELGSLQITLRVEAQQVSALVEVEHSAARDVLLANLPQLQGRLAEQGLNVSQFDVQVVDPNQWSQGSGQGAEPRNGQGASQNDGESGRSSRYLERLRNQLDRPPATDLHRPTSSPWTRKNGELDVRV